MPSHTLPPAQCSANTYSFTDPTLSTSVKVRKTHIEELRTQIAAELSRRGLSAAPAYTDPTLYSVSSPSKTKVRKMHITELRTQIEAIHDGRGTSGYCPGDTVTIAWTDTPSTSVKARKGHIAELRTTLNALKSGCICETEQCEYCADCGHYYYTWACWCYVNSVGCCNSCGPQACSYYCNQGNWNCGSVNTGGTHPYKSFSPAVSWDGTVPWAWGDGIPGAAINWTAHWSCKCNPFATS